MAKVIATYLVKLTVRSDSVEDFGLTNDEVGDAVAESLVEAITAKTLEEGGEAELEIEVNATTVERTDN